MELATHAAVWGCSFLNSSPSSPPQAPFSITEVLSAGHPAPYYSGNVPKGGGRAAGSSSWLPWWLACDEIWRDRRCQVPCDPGMRLFSYAEFSVLPSTAKTKKRTVKFENALIFSLS